MGNDTSKGKQLGPQEWRQYLDHSKENFQKCSQENGNSPVTSPAPGDIKPAMGNDTFTFEDFVFYTELGSGAFADVFLVLHRAAKIWIALKVLNKDKVVAKGQEEHVMTEKKLLSLMDLPFIIRLHVTFQTKANLCLGLEYVPGGELFTLLRQKRYFSESQAIFYASQVILALEYMHNLDIVYRDLKPENILLNSKGYLKVADLGFAKVVPKRTYTMCGTPEYIAPEILTYKGYGKAVDWWALGVLIYEMLCGMSAFYAEDVFDIYAKIVEARVKFPRQMNLTKTARHLIKHLLEKDLTKRYGTLHAGVADIRDHPWFTDLNWAAIFQAEAPAPFKINVSTPSRPECEKMLSKLNHEELLATQTPNAKHVELFAEF